MTNDAAGAQPRATIVTNAVGAPPARDLRALSADEILRTMRESYARLTSYTDRGRLTRHWHEARRVYADVGFRTFFKRPLLYRFEWLGDRDPYRDSYWSNPNGIFSRKAQEPPLVHSPLAAVFPYSSIPGPHHVLQWIAPAATRPDPWFFNEATRLDDESVDGVACFHLSGTTSLKKIERHLWIAQDDFMLRRVRTTGPYAYSLSNPARYGSGSETVQIDYVDVTTELGLPDELFQFTPVK